MKSYTSTTPSPARHTPGPWKVYPDVDRDGGIQVGEHGKAVCSVYGERDWSDTRGLPLVEQGRRNANARLIAAAPDLLEACEEVVASNLEPGGLGGGYITMSGDAIRRLHAAISKARGGAA